MGRWLARYDTRGKLKLEYPVARKDYKGISQWEVSTIYISSGDNNMLTVKRFVDKSSKVYSIHPALALAFLLCESPLYIDNIEISRQDQSINLRISSPDVSSQAVLKAYSLARAMVQDQLKRRRASLKIRFLCYFIKENSYLSWDELLVKWNNEVPQWNYSSASSMQVVYSRANDKFKRF